MQNSHSKIILPELPEKLKRLSKEEKRVQNESILHIKGDAGLDKKLTAYENAMDVVYSHVKEHKNENDDELTIQYIGIRLFNSLAISLRLMLTGYYQASFSMQRDIIEMAFLLDYFHHFPTKIQEWKKTTNDERIVQYGPKKIRDALDKEDGFANKKREKKYKMFCEYAAHVSYPGFKLVAPKIFAELGPFYDEKYLKGCLNELIENGLYSVLLFMEHFDNVTDKNILRIQTDFLKYISDWYKERFNKELKIDLKELDELLDILFEE